MGFYFEGMYPPPPETPLDSPFRGFVVQCLNCKSWRVRAVPEYNEDAGEVRVFLVCQLCQRREAAT